MKKINGGEILLDISDLGLEETEEFTEIEDAGIIEQLTNLKTFIKNPVSIKPIWIRLFNDETNELVVVKGELSYSSVGEFNIHVKTRGYNLTINIQFTQMLNDNEDPIDDWYIDDGDATYEFTSNVASSGTKLYLHEISFEDNNILYNIKIVSTRSVKYPLTLGSDELLSDVTKFGARIYNDDLGLTSSILYILQIDTDLDIAYVNDNPSVTNISIPGVTQSTDTVTEL